MQALLRLGINKTWSYFLDQILGCCLVRMMSKFCEILSKLSANIFLSKYFLMIQSLQFSNCLFNTSLLKQLTFVKKGDTIEPCLSRVSFPDLLALTPTQFCGISKNLFKNYQISATKSEKCLSRPVPSLNTDTNSNINITLQDSSSIP